MRQQISISAIGTTRGVLTCINVIRINGRSKAVCKCECGNKKKVELCFFKSKEHLVCCCAASKLRSEAGKKGRKHIIVNERLYNIWENMKQRCYNPKAKNYHNYGGRGISVCAEWMDYSKFLLWSLANGYAYNLTLDRERNNENYEPGNCRWITNIEQQANKRDSRKVTFNGETLIVSEWARRFNVNRSRILYHINKGKSLQSFVK